LEKGDEKYRPLVIQPISGATRFQSEGNERKDFWLVDNHAYAKDAANYPSGEAKRRIETVRAVSTRFA